MQPDDVTRSYPSPVVPTGAQPAVPPQTPSVGAPPNNLRLENDQAVSVSANVHPTTLDEKVATVTKNRMEEAQILRRLQENPRAMEAKKKEIAEAKEKLSKPSEIKGTLKATAEREKATKKVAELERELGVLIIKIKEDGVKLFKLRGQTEPLAREVDQLLKAKVE